MEINKVPEKILPDISMSLVLVFLGMFAITGAFELARYFFLPHAWDGEPLVLTVILASAGAVIIAYFPLKSLRAAEARLDTLLEGSPVPQFIIDADHRVVSWNRSLELLSGITAAEMVGTRGPWRAFYPEKRSTLADILVDEDLATLPERYESAIIKSETLEGAYESLDYFPNAGKHGAWFFFTAVPVRDKQGTIIGAVESFVDLTERKQFEKELQKNRILLDDSLDLAKMAYWDFDQDSGKFVFNDRFYSLYGTSAEREGGYKISTDEYIRNFIYTDDQEYLRSVIEKATALREPETISEQEHRILRRDGEVRYINARVHIIRDDDGHIIRSNGVNQDITERRKAELALKESNARFLSFIKEAAMRLKNPLEVVETNLGSVIGDIDNGEAVCGDTLLLLKIQVKNLAQIRENIIELNKAIVGHAEGFSEASKKFLTE
ncbi:PAS domain-containing protein [Methanoregula sp. UBA64]|jgi:PAS domain S-box-containing protein|uniref:PAS domain-containing protein n=1 Tax=Methanoregula sp. UBA64 TaxID=1915554 RepID=UPI0025CF5359|nr:PAS domain S-box protein [Methanoregula sp. UBA64]